MDPTIDSTAIAAAITARIGTPTQTQLPPSTIVPGLPHGPTGDFIKDWLGGIQRRYGVEPYTPDIAAAEVRKRTPLPPLAPFTQPSLSSDPASAGGSRNEWRLDQLLRPEHVQNILGFRHSPLDTFSQAAASAWWSGLEVNKALAQAEPDYDPFSDPQIRAAGFDNQMHLFVGSTSRRNTEQMITRIHERQKDAEWINKSDGLTRFTNLVGGMFADPLTYTPMTIGVKGAQLARRAREGLLTGAELKMLSQRPAVWGAIGDGVRSAGVSAAFSIAETLLLHGLDPTIPAEIGEELLIPTALGGSIGLLTGLFGRWAGRSLAAEVRQAGYMAPPGARPSGAGQRAGGIAGDVPGAPAPAVVRLSGEIDHDFHGAAEAMIAGQSRSAAELQPGHRMMTPNGEVWTVKVDDTGRPRFYRERKPSDAAVPDSNGGAFAPGALASEYGPMLRREHETSGHAAGFEQPPAVRGTGTADDPIHTGQPAGKHLDWRGVFFADTHEGMKNAADYPAGTHFLSADGVVFKAEAPRQGGTPYFVKVKEPELKASPETGGRGFVDMEFKPGELPEALEEGAHQPGSVGAQLNPQSLAYQQSVLLAQGRLAPTGIGLERWGINPVVRAFQGASLAMMRLAADLVSTGGLMTRGNLQGIANLPPVEAMIAQNWNRPLVQALRDMQDKWSAYRHAAANANAPGVNTVDWQGRSDASRLAEQVGTALKDRFTSGEKPLSYSQFRSRVGSAWRNGDVDAVQDAATPYVEAAAAGGRKMYELVKQRASEVGVFDEVYKDAMYQAQSELRAIKKEGDEVKRTAQKEKWSATKLREAEEALLVRYEDAQFKMKQTEALLDKLRTNGPFLDGTAPSFAPRMYRTDRLIDNEEAFITKTVAWLQSRGAAGGTIVDTQEAVRIAKQIHEVLSKQNPIYERGDAQALFKSVAGPQSAHARSFRIPDALIKEFLVDDAEEMLRFHIKQMGAAIEMKARFGSLDLADEIAEVQQDYRTQIQAARDAGKHEQAAVLTKQMKTAIEDAQALRDKIYGTYGASPDPHRWQSRTIRMAKQFSNITLLGMSGITAIGDLARPIMTEGLEAVYGYGFKSLVSEARETILRMNRRELELDGNGMELLNNVRALQAADTGDFFGGRGKVEHALNQTNSWFFVANGLNAMNQIGKEWARISIGGRVNHVLLDLLADRSFSSIDRGRFAAVGIDEVIGKRIAIQLQVHGIDFGSGGNALTMPNTEKWTDTHAREVYRSAMWQMVNRTVPTPGIGDRPNFMSTEMGSLLTQYKSFGVASLIRGAYSGLQEGGNAFWYGAAMSVGFAVLLNEIRSQLFYDKSTFDKPLPAILADGVDRASIIGVLGDANKALETLSGNRFGVRPMLGAARPSDPSFTGIAGLAGPSIGQAARVTSLANDLLHGHATAQTWRNWRTLTPGNTLPYADPLMDAIFPTNYQRASRPKN